jgi:alkanesulfonate monooxygenase SsuD/methylene tetrahydromethanopterin reductase-like flavin-dependent oxidoreductase (luciferase family)
MQVGFFFWPFSPELVTRMTEAAEHYGYDMIGIADTPGNAMDPWVAMALAARTVRGPRIALCVGNLTTRHPATTAAAIASIDPIAPGRAVLGIGTGHSSPRNLGIRVSSAGDLEEGLRFLRVLLTGSPASYRGGQALGNPVVCGISGRVRAQGAGYCRPSCQRRLYQFWLAPREYCVFRDGGCEQRKSVGTKSR